MAKHTACVQSNKLQRKPEQDYGFCLAVTIKGHIFFPLGIKKTKEKQSGGYSPCKSFATHNVYFDDSIFLQNPNNYLKWFTLYPHLHKALLHKRTTILKKSNHYCKILIHF